MWPLSFEEATHSVSAPLARRVRDLHALHALHAPHAHARGHPCLPVGVYPRTDLCLPFRGGKVYLRTLCAGDHRDHRGRRDPDPIPGRLCG